MADPASGKGNGEEEGLGIDFGAAGPLMRKYLPLALLLLIVLWGYSLRAYHLDYPVIGYHNTKEAHTLGEALNFYRGDPLLIPRIHYYAPDDPTRGIHGDNFPLVGWMIALGWKLFGLRLWVARLVIVLFSLGIIVLTYAAMRALFGREDISLLAALLAAANPLMVFFGRNVQYDTPSAFFAMGAMAAYLKWREEPKALWFCLMSSSAALGAATKWPALLIVVPILATFPWKRVIALGELKKYLGQYLLAVPAFLFMAWWWVFSNALNPLRLSIGKESLAFVGQFLTGIWWKTVYQYAVTDNFSAIGLWIALFGVALAFISIGRFSYRLLAVWAASSLLYGLLFANFLRNHNYYQVPYAPLWAMLAAAFLSFCVSFIPRVKLGPLPRKSLRWLALLAIFLFVLRAPLKESADRQFATQFYGLDVAGEYIKAHSSPGELIFDSGHQDRGILWHADRELSFMTNLSDMVAAEEEWNLSWVLVYQWGAGRIMGVPEIASRIYANYTLRQFAYCFGCLGGGPQQANEVYTLYQRGGSSPTREEFLANISLYAQGRPQQKRVYDDPFGRRIELFILTFE